MLCEEVADVRSEIHGWRYRAGAARGHELAGAGIGCAAPHAKVPPKAGPQSDPPAAQVESGRKQFSQSCAFCHGADATGGRGADLVRSTLVAHDQKGDLIGEVIENGGTDKGVRAFPATAEQIADIAAFLHARAREAILSSGVPSDSPVEK